jgi:dihydroorotate dehydrogenase
MYRTFFRLFLRRLEAERAHALAKNSLRVVRATPPGRALVHSLVGATPSCLETQAFGLTFPSPLGVAAGLDKDATWFEDLGALGFGFVEVVTITMGPQPGNPTPRIARVVNQRALVNRMGFPNRGAKIIARRLARRPARPIVGVNIGKSVAVALDDAPRDYARAVTFLAPVADYLEALRSLVAEVRDALSDIKCSRPLLVKIGADLEDERLDAIVSLAIELRLDGIVAVNTTTDHEVLKEASAAVASLGGGGVSGEPLWPRALEVLRRIRRLAGDELVVVSVGGVGSAQDVWQRLLAGATLVQAYTAFVYEGPAWPARVNREVAHRMRAAGVCSVGDLIGAEGAHSADQSSPSTPVRRPLPAAPHPPDFPATQDRAP